MSRRAIIAVCILVSVVSVGLIVAASIGVRPWLEGRIIAGVTGAIGLMQVGLRIATLARTETDNT